MPRVDIPSHESQDYPHTTPNTFVWKKKKSFLFSCLCRCCWTHPSSEPNLSGQPTLAASLSVSSVHPAKWQQAHEGETKATRGPSFSPPLQEPPQPCMTCTPPPLRTLRRRVEVHRLTWAASCLLLHNCPLPPPRQLLASSAVNLTIIICPLFTSPSWEMTHESWIPKWGLKHVLWSVYCFHMSYTVVLKIFFPTFSLFCVHHSYLFNLRGCGYGKAFVCLDVNHVCQADVKSVINAEGTSKAPPCTFLLRQVKPAERIHLGTIFRCTCWPKMAAPDDISMQNVLYNIIYYIHLALESSRPGENSVARLEELFNPD